MRIISLSDPMWGARISKPVTFEPFEQQKWQSTKNGSTLHQKPVYSIRQTNCTVVPMVERR